VSYSFQGSSEAKGQGGQLSATTGSGINNTIGGNPNTRNAMLYAGIAVGVLLVVWMISRQKGA